MTSAENAVMKSRTSVVKGEVGGVQRGGSPQPLSYHVGSCWSYSVVFTLSTQNQQHQNNYACSAVISVMVLITFAVNID